MRVRGGRVRRARRRASGAREPADRRLAEPAADAGGGRRGVAAAVGVRVAERGEAGRALAPAGVVGLEAPRRGGAPTAPGPGRRRRRRPGRAARRARPRARARARPPRPRASGARSRGPGRRRARPRRSARRRRRRARRRRVPPRRPRARRSSRPRRRPPGARRGGASVPAPPHASAPARDRFVGPGPESRGRHTRGGRSSRSPSGAVPQRSPACAGGSRDSLIASSP